MKLMISVLTASLAMILGAPAQAAANWDTTTIKGVVFVSPRARNRGPEKIDFAELERLYPLDKQALQTWQQADLATLSQEQLDQLYARLTAGPIPNGAYRGDIVFRKNGGLQGIASKFIPFDPLVGLKFKLLESFGEYMWKGKHFYREESVLRNLIPDGLLHRAAIKTIAFGLLGTSPRFDELVQTRVDGVPYFELFPAKLYCGQSLLDARRESVVIDYAYGDTLPGYNADVDVLATRKVLSVRDEIRMVRPGLYLGRAYIRQVFGLIFTLSNEDAARAGDATESCSI